MKGIIIFEKKILANWDNEDEKWLFSNVDAIEALTGTERPHKYWNNFKL